MGQCCGGRVEVFFEPVMAKKSATLFGGGHVGRAVAQVLSKMPFDVSVVDARPEWSGREGLPEDIRVCRADPVEYARSRSWSENDAVCIFTHNHDLDFALASFFLTQPVGYLGLIGSEHKSQVFQAKLGDSLAELWEEKMHCPMGLPLESKSPKVIAVSIAAELLKEWGLKKAAPAPEHVHA
jgi:xanthine dehydrogenase accessory factor